MKLRDPNEWILLAFAAVSLAAMVGGWHFGQIRWEEFKVNHHCKAVAAPSGVFSKTAWLCDGGMTYFR